jgi:hypothetical protein
MLRNLSVHNGALTQEPMSTKLTLFNPVSGIMSSHTMDSLENVEMEDLPVAGDATRPMLSPAVVEAVVVLFDASDSMNDPAFGPGDTGTFLHVSSKPTPGPRVAPMLASRAAREAPVLVKRGADGGGAPGVPVVSR